MAVNFTVKHKWIKVFNYLCLTHQNLVDAYIEQVEKEVAHIKIETTEQEKQEQWEKLCKKIREYEEKRK